MSNDPKKPEPPKKTGITRRGLFGFAGGSAAKAVVPGIAGGAASSAEAQIEFNKLMGDFNKIVYGANDSHLNAIKNNLPSSLFTPSSMSSFEGRQSSNERILSNAQQQLPKAKELFAKLHELAKKNQIVVPEGDVLSEVAKDSILDGELFQRHLLNRITRLETLTNEFAQVLPEAHAKMGKAKLIHEQMQKALKEKFPGKDIDELIGQLSKYVPKETNWIEHFSNPAHIESAVEKEAQEPQPAKEAVERLTKKHNEKKLNETAQTLGAFFEQECQSDDKCVYIGVLARSTELYEALKNVIIHARKANKEASTDFPSHDELFPPKVMIDNEIIATNQEIRVPPTAYVLALPKEIAGELEGIVNGEVKPRLAVPRESRGKPENAIANYRIQAEFAAVLCGELEQLKNAVRGKWVSKTVAKDTSIVHIRS